MKNLGKCIVKKSKTKDKVNVTLGSTDLLLRRCAKSMTNSRKKSESLGQMAADSSKEASIRS